MAHQVDSPALGGMSGPPPKTSDRRSGKPSRAEPRTGSVNARLVVQTWLGTRLLMLAIAAGVMLTQQRSFYGVFANWDAQLYLKIAADGYAEPNSIAFFPGWPLLLRIGSLIAPPVIVGVVLALVGSILATGALYRLGGSRAAIAWLLAPTAVFTLVPYTESAFCAAAFWAWERASAKSWGAAAALAALAASFRVSGVFLVAALAVLALTQAGRTGERIRRLVWLIAPTAVVVAYMGYLYAITGNWRAWLDAQAAGWPRGFTWPWEALMNTLAVLAPGAYPGNPEWRWVFTAELISMAVGLAATIVCLVKRRLGEATWIGTQLVAFSTSYWFMSVNRAVLLWFPLWTLIGRAADRQAGKPGKIGLGVLVIPAILVQGLWAWLFFMFRWAS